MSARLASACVLGLGAAVFGVLDSRRGEIMSRTDAAVVVRLESYEASCLGPDPEREVREDGVWTTLERRPWSGVVLDGEALPHAMCCTVSCQRVETGKVDLRRYTHVGEDTTSGGTMRVYTSAPIESPIRATFDLYVEPTCTVPRQVRVTVEP